MNKVELNLINLTENKMTYLKSHSMIFVKPQYLLGLNVERPIPTSDATAKCSIIRIRRVCIKH